MSELRLKRQDLGEGIIDLGYGEPLIVRQLLGKYYPQMNVGIDLGDQWYQPPKGNKDLVSLLEKKYMAKVVITAGAKQGIAAVMYALKKLGHTTCVIPSPYWTAHPGIITDANLGVEILSTGDISRARAVMITSPNNPDGKEGTKAQFKFLTKMAKKDNCILIHDAAYYTPIYVQHPKNIGKVGDVQIYSLSKMYGLSGLRIGYVVIHNEELLQHVVDFVERSSSGVSNPAQCAAFQVENFFQMNPQKLDAFHDEARNIIALNRNELSALNPEVLEVMPCKSNSMFAWCKVGPKLDHVAAKVNLISGSMFGSDNSMMRMNLAVNSDLIKEAVERLNNACKNKD